MSELDRLLRQAGERRALELKPPETPVLLFRRPQNRVATWMWAAAALVLVMLGWMWPRPPVVAVPRADVRPPLVARVEPEPSLPVVAVAPRVRPAWKVAVTRPVRRTPVEPFVAVDGAEALPLPASAYVFRVELSRESLAAFGFAAEPAGEPGLIRADLLVGDDGLARGIRLVQ